MVAAIAIPHLVDEGPILRGSCPRGKWIGRPTGVKLRGKDGPSRRFFGAAALVRKAPRKRPQRHDAADLGAREAHGRFELGNPGPGGRRPHVSPSAAACGILHHALRSSVGRAPA